MAANVQQSTENYAVKSIETVLEGVDVKARIFTLAPSDVIPWHYHSEVTDHFITAANPHTVSNRGPTDCQFLLLQGVGRYDWKKARL
jgi:quercetin dioxygenase-like cupin family protein